jgi:hypothetical protein
MRGSEGVDEICSRLGAIHMGSVRRAWDSHLGFSQSEELMKMARCEAIIKAPDVCTRSKNTLSGYELTRGGIVHYLIPSDDYPARSVFIPYTKSPIISTKLFNRY